MNIKLKLYNIITSLFLISFLYSCNYKTTDYENRIPFSIIHNSIIIKARVGNSAIVNFIFDTGCATSVVDSSFASIHKFRPYAETTSNTSCGRITKPILCCNYKINGFMSHSDSTLITSLKSINPKTGFKFYGFIGRDLFRNKIIKIDFENNYIYIYNSLYEGSVDGYKSFNTSKLLTIEAESIFRNDEKMTGKYLFDTGCQFGVALSTINENVSRINDLIGNYKTDSNICSFKFYIGSLKRLKLDTFQINAPITALSIATSGALDGVRYKGLIGLPSLKQFNIIIDFPHYIISLKPNKFYGKN